MRYYVWILKKWDFRSRSWALTSHNLLNMYQRFGSTADVLCKVKYLLMTTARGRFLPKIWYSYKITRRHESEAIVMIRQLAASYHQSQRIRSYLHQLFWTDIRSTPLEDIRDTPNNKCNLSKSPHKTNFLHRTPSVRYQRTWPNCVSASLGPSYRLLR